MKKKLGIIGASYLQEPLINKAKQMGYETHVFAWQCGDIGEKIADYFYPISIVEVDKILEKCREIKIDGICTIATDLGVITVNKVAQALGLPSNNLECTLLSTNKSEMRKAFELNHDPSPKNVLIENINEVNSLNLNYPVIVKPIDRSGSRGITKVNDFSELKSAIENAKSVGFEKKVLIEEFVTGTEYSVEFISYKGRHMFLAMTRKYTTGAPNFIETGHFQPADISDEMLNRVINVLTHALDSLKIDTGASHCEIKIDDNNNINIIEIGGRMGGDYIGSHLVKLSTGIDFVEQVINCALGIEPDLTSKSTKKYAGVRFIFDEDDLNVLNAIKNEDENMIVEETVNPISNEKITDSSSRFGAFVFASKSKEKVLSYMPSNKF